MFCLESNHKGATIVFGGGVMKVLFCLESNHKGATISASTPSSPHRFALNLITRVLQ